MKGIKNANVLRKVFKVSGRKEILKNKPLTGQARDKLHWARDRRQQNETGSVRKKSDVEKSSKLSPKTCNWSVTM